MSEEFGTWKEFEEQLNLTQEKEAEIEFEMEIMNAIRKSIEKGNIEQKDIKKIEKCINSTEIRTMIQLLNSIGYTLRIMPIVTSRSTR